MLITNETNTQTQEKQHSQLGHGTPVTYQYKKESLKKKGKKRASQRLLICLSHLCLLLLWELMKQQTEGRFPVLVRY